MRYTKDFYINEIEKMMEALFVLWQGTNLSYHPVAVKIIAQHTGGKNYITTRIKKAELQAIYEDLLVFISENNLEIYSIADNYIIEPSGPSKDIVVPNEKEDAQKVLECIEKYSKEISVSEPKINTIRVVFSKKLQKNKAVMEIFEKNRKSFNYLIEICRCYNTIHQRTIDSLKEGLTEKLNKEICSPEEAVYIYYIGGSLNRYNDLLLTSPNFKFGNRKFFKTYLEFAEKRKKEDKTFEWIYEEEVEEEDLDFAIYDFFTDYVNKLEKKFNTENISLEESFDGYYYLTVKNLVNLVFSIIPTEENFKIEVECGSLLIGEDEDEDEIIFTDIQMKQWENILNNII